MSEQQKRISKQREAASRHFQEGQEANRGGKPQSANPYGARDADAAYHWDEGWETEQKAAYGDD